MSGIEWVVEAFGCSSESLRDLRAALLTHYATNKLKSLEVLTGTGEQTIRGLTKLDEFCGFKNGTDKGMKAKDITNARWLGFIEQRRSIGSILRLSDDSATLGAEL